MFDAYPIHTMKYILTAMTAILLLSCSKSNEAPLQVAAEKTASIQTWRYACGPACDAAAWVLVLTDGSSFEAANLPESFHNQNQDVLVRFNKTGKRNSGYAGTGLELVTILGIRKK